MSAYGVRVLQYLKCSGRLVPFHHRRTIMCGGLCFSPAPTRLPLAHCARTVTDHVSVFPHSIAEETIRCCFPDVFSTMVVFMFLSPYGYTGVVDNDYVPCARRWYGLSYGCINRDALPLWRKCARMIRQTFWSQLWKWIRSFGKAPWPDPSELPIVLLAFIDPFPERLFDRAIQRLIDRKFLTMKKAYVKSLDESVMMYYPTKALGECLLGHSPKT